MAQLDNYEGPAKLQLDGRTLAEITTARVRVNGNNRRVFTMRKGLAGRSRGPRETEISLEGAIPRAGYEKDFLAALLDDDNLRLVYSTGGKRITVNFWIDDWEQSANTDGPATFSVSGAGPAPTQR